MNLIIDGTERGGREEFVEDISENFEPTRTWRIKEKRITKRIEKTIKEPNSDSFVSPEFFARGVLKGLDSNNVFLWEQGWISAIVKQQANRKIVDEFAYEFIARRLMQNRGAYYVILPETKEQYYLRFPSSEIEDDYVPLFELEQRYENFAAYAERWNYPIVYHDFSIESLEGAIMDATKETLLNMYPFPQEQYIGTKTPKLTFVGNMKQEFGFRMLPFHSNSMVHYFRSFQQAAIHDFGYCSIEGYQEIFKTKWKKSLLKNPIAVGSLAKAYFPDLPAIELNREWSIQDLERFRISVNKIAKDYGVNWNER